MKNFANFEKNLNLHVFKFHTAMVIANEFLMTGKPKSDLFLHVYRYSGSFILKIFVWENPKGFRAVFCGYFANG
jgi:hypothetical protein